MSKVGNSQDIDDVLPPIPAGTPPANSAPTTMPEEELPPEGMGEDLDEEPTEKKKPAFTPTKFTPPPDMPELGGICWTEMYGQREMNDKSIATFKINCTGRGRTAKEAFANLVELITDGKMSPEEFRASVHLGLIQYQPPRQNSPAPLKPLNEVVGNGTAVTSQATGAATPPPTAVGTVSSGAQATDATQGGVFDIVCLDVTPRSDGKVKLDFFGNDKKQPRNQYPSVYWVTDIDHALDKLKTVAGFSAGHMKVAGSFNLPCKLHWVPGGLNSKGNPYKNVDYLEPA